MARRVRRFGQHFLEAAWVRKVVDVISPQPNEIFIEIGPGGGALTVPLSERSTSVVAVEIEGVVHAANVNRGSTFRVPARG